MQNKVTLPLFEAYEDTTVEVLTPHLAIPGLAGTYQLWIQDGTGVGRSFSLTVNGRMDSAADWVTVVGPLTAAGTSTIARWPEYQFVLTLDQGTITGGVFDTADGDWVISAQPTAGDTIDLIDDGRTPAGNTQKIVFYDNGLSYPDGGLYHGSEIGTTITETRDNLGTVLTALTAAGLWHFDATPNGSDRVTATASVPGTAGNISFTLPSAWAGGSCTGGIGTPLLVSFGMYL